MDPQAKLAQIFAYGKWLYPYIILLHGASDLDQCLKRAVLRTDVLLNKISSPLPQKFPQNLSMQSDVRPNGATKLKLYSYNGIGKYLGCVKIFLLGASGGAGPHNVNYPGNYYS